MLELSCILNCSLLLSHVMLNVCNVLMVKRKSIEVIRVNRSNKSSKRVVAIEERIRKSDILHKLNSLDLKVN